MDKMNDFEGFGAIKPVALSTEIISIIMGQFSQKLKEKIIAEKTIPINLIDAKKIVTMHWDYMTLSQLVVWLKGNKTETNIKIQLIKKISLSRLSKQVLGFDKFEKEDRKCSIFVSGSRIDDLVATIECLIRIGQLEIKNNEIIDLVLKNLSIENPVNLLK